MTDFPALIAGRKMNETAEVTTRRPLSTIQRQYRQTVSACDSSTTAREANIDTFIQALTCAE